jgi:hypothetical protein
MNLLTKHGTRYSRLPIASTVITAGLNVEVTAQGKAVIPMSAYPAGFTYWVLLVTLRNELPVMPGRGCLLFHQSYGLCELPRGEWGRKVRREGEVYHTRSRVRTLGVNRNIFRGGKKNFHFWGAKKFF